MLILNHTDKFTNTQEPLINMGLAIKFVSEKVKYFSDRTSRVNGRIIELDSPNRWVETRQLKLDVNKHHRKWMSPKKKKNYL